MKAAESSAPTSQDVLAGPPETGSRVQLTLFGFEQVQDYLWLQHPGEEPFCWLQMVGEPNLSFLVVSPAFLQSSYRPDINPADVGSLGITGSEDAILFNIVTLRKDQPPTANLKGPVVLNRHTGVGKQVIPTNASDYLLHYPLPVAE